MRPPSEGVRTGLVLTRSVGEAIYIGRDIMVTVTENRQGQVKLHIAAPMTVAISRAEFPLASHFAACEKRERSET